tara:strand:+ start:789 stop:944 length:156 start_codon:yes stop_codon:yes gene_type:complete
VKSRLTFENKPVVGWKTEVWPIFTKTFEKINFFWAFGVNVGQTNIHFVFLM